MNKTVRLGQEVLFTPSKNTREVKFKKTKPRENYIGKVTDINEDSVDLTVFDNGQMVYVKNVKHSSEAKKDGSKWDYQEGDTPKK